MIASKSENRRRDTHLLQNICFRLAWPAVLTRLLVIVGVLIVWFWVVTSVLAKTTALRYDSFDVLGAQVVEFLTRINPYLWKGLLLIASLFILAGLRSYIIKSLAKGRTALVQIEIINELSQKLSPEAIDVLLWVWKDKEVPINYGNLQTLLKQLRGGRVKKLALARDQNRVLTKALAQNGTLNTDSSRSVRVGQEPRFRD